MIGYHQCDVALVVPLPEEFTQLQRIAQCPDQYRIGSRTYSRLLGTHLNVWATCVGEMGNAPTLECTRDAIDSLNPRIVVCAGIGGSLQPNDLQLGELSVSRWVKDIADAAKVQDVADTYVLKTMGRPFRADDVLVGIIENLREADLQAWKIGCTQRLTESGLAGAKHDLSADWPRVQVRGFASGFVLASRHLRLTTTDRELGIAETEGAGVGRAVRNIAPFVVIRGVSDYADLGKESLETATKNLWRSLAAANAFSFVLLTLQLPAVRSHVMGLAGGRGFAAWPLSSMTPAEARKKVADILSARKARGDRMYLVPYLGVLNQVIGVLQPSINIEEDVHVVDLLMDLFAYFLYRSAESPTVRLTIAQDIHSRIQRFRTGRERTFDELPLAAEVHHQDASLARRRGELASAIYHMHECIRLDENFGRTLDWLSHKRCLYCMQAELLSPVAVELCPAMISAIDEIDQKMETAKHQNGEHRTLSMRISNTLVQAKAAIFTDSVGTLKASLEKAGRLLEEFRECEARLSPAYPYYDEYHAMWTCYLAVSQWAEGHEQEAIKTLRDTKEWARKTQLYDYCYLYLPDKYRGLLGSIFERLPTCTK